jgi:hypothetical protein
MRTTVVHTDDLARASTPEDQVLTQPFHPHRFPGGHILGFQNHVPVITNHVLSPRESSRFAIGRARLFLREAPADLIGWIIHRTEGL